MMKKYATFESIAGHWMLEFRNDHSVTGELLRICAENETVLSVSETKDGISAVIHTLWESDTERFGRNPELDFLLSSPQTGDRIRICWQEYSFRLYVDDVLRDEEWPLGSPAGGIWTLQAEESVSSPVLSALTETVPDPEQSFRTPFQYFAPPGHNTGVGDCMPFVRDKRFCLYYLYDRRRHGSKKGLGAHQWAQVSSADLKEWTIHPMAVGITEQWEGSICTGSLIQRDDKIYAFYAVRMSDGSPAKLTWAVSEDGVHFIKSGKSFTLTAPYEPVSARDPMVFSDGEGTYHMLVTTSLEEGGEYGGCLAHLTSPDLSCWKQREPFLVPGYSDQPECSDYFYKNGWYYLIFSNFGAARYRMSKEPFGPWIRPEMDELDSPEIRVPKTAEFSGRRFSVGFLDRRPRGYAGNAVVHELCQRPDGTLGVEHVEELLPSFRRIDCPAQLVVAAGGGRGERMLPEAAGGFRLQAVLEPRTSGMLAGICIRVAGRTYRIEMDPAARTAVVWRPGESPWDGNGNSLLRCMSLREKISLDMIVYGDILDVSFGNGRMLTMRLDDDAEGGCCPGFYAIAGTLEVEAVRYQILL